MDSKYIKRKQRYKTSQTDGVKSWLIFMGSRWGAISAADLNIKATDPINRRAFVTAPNGRTIYSVGPDGFGGFCCRDGI